MGNVAALVPAAGAGVRLGPGDPKALRPLRGEPLLVHAVRRLWAAESVGGVVIAAPPGHEPAVRRLLGPKVIVVPGGADRQESVAAALGAVPPDRVVLVHDAARALTPPDLIDAWRRRCGPGTTPSFRCCRWSTLVKVRATRRVDGGLDRSVLRAVQTPQGFHRSCWRPRMPQPTEVRRHRRRGLVAGSACRSTACRVHAARHKDHHAGGSQRRRACSPRRIGSRPWICRGSASAPTCTPSRPDSAVLGRGPACGRMCRGWPATPTATSPPTPPATRCCPRPARRPRVATSAPTVPSGPAPPAPRCWPSPTAGARRPVTRLATSRSR